MMSTRNYMCMEFVQLSIKSQGSRQSPESFLVGKSYLARDYMRQHFCGEHCSTQVPPYVYPKETTSGKVVELGVENCQYSVLITNICLKALTKLNVSFSRFADN
jgi:hypothetical protein